MDFWELHSGLLVGVGRGRSVVIGEIVGIVSALHFIGLLLLLKVVQLHEMHVLLEILLLQILLLLLGRKLLLWWLCLRRDLSVLWWLLLRLWSLFVVVVDNVGIVVGIVVASRRGRRGVGLNRFVFSSHHNRSVGGRCVSGWKIAGITSVGASRRVGIVGTGRSGGRGARSAVLSEIDIFQRGRVVVGVASSVDLRGEHFFLLIWLIWLKILRIGWILLQILILILWIRLWMIRSEIVGIGAGIGIDVFTFENCSEIDGTSV